jgi:hypothetical protein
VNGGSISRAPNLGLEAQCRTGAAHGRLYCLLPLQLAPIVAAAHTDDSTSIAYLCCRVCNILAKLTIALLHPVEPDELAVDAMVEVVHRRHDWQVPNALLYLEKMTSVSGLVKWFSPDVAGRSSA